MNETSTTIATSVWPCLNYQDAHRAIAFLTEAFGFAATAVYEGGPERPVAHAELRWPGGGGVMLGSANPSGNEFERLPTGAASTYVVCDDPDGLFARATAAGAEVVRELRDEDYGSRGFTVRDPEGNLWSFGTYGGE
ncbi:MAG TPA: VOC family protein [Acidimicrobiales bacterium]|nr:VOC family protein [Acidimicrobiales bacterium]